MIIPLVDLLAQYNEIKTEIDSAIKNVIQKSAFIRGDFVEEFESKFAEQFGVKHCIGVANGTDALFIAMKMLGIGAGDEVITTSLSWIATSETISLTGAKPVFVDIEEDYYTIDPDKIEEKITSTTKAIIPVHLYGQCADMDPIIKIAEKYNLYIIEDAAQAHFAEYKTIKAGTFGIAGTFSFYPGKNLGAYGDAGAIITNDDELGQKMRMFANHGALQKHHHHMEGINSRLDGIQAAILTVKLKYLAKWNTRRMEIADEYNQKLININEVGIPKQLPERKSVHHIYPIVVEKQYRDKLCQYLNHKSIQTGIHYPYALPELPAYQYLGHNENDFPVSSRHAKTEISLPIYPELKQEGIDYIYQSIKEFFKLQ